MALLSLQNDCMQLPHYWKKWTWSHIEIPISLGMKHTGP